MVHMGQGTLAECRTVLCAHIVCLMHMQEGSVIGTFGPVCFEGPGREGLTVLCAARLKWLPHSYC